MNKEKERIEQYVLRRRLFLFSPDSAVSVFGTGEFEIAGINRVGDISSGNYRACRDPRQ